MIQLLSDMMWPLLACFVLVGIHSYLGIHVIARKVIFVDLALAQIAALGAVYGVFLGYSFDANFFAVKIVSVIFTLLGALLISFTRTEDKHVPHEAIIGIIYAAALSMTIMVTANLPHGADEVRQLLAGSILWVTPKEVLFTAGLYSLIGLIHFVFRRQFFALSNASGMQEENKINVKLWDFIFYATFGVVVTSSVGMGGVLLVFGFLVIPSVIGVMLAEKTKTRLIIGWSTGALMSMAGVVVSYFLDLPSGPTIVVMLGALLIVVAIFVEIIHKKTRWVALGHICLLGSVLILLMFAPYVIKIFQEHPESQGQEMAHRLHHGMIDDDELASMIKAGLNAEDVFEKIKAAELIIEKESTEFLSEIHQLLSDRDHRVRQVAVRTIRILKQKKSVPILKRAFTMEKDEFIKIELAGAALSLGEKNGLLFLLELAKNAQSEFAREDALIHLQDWIDFSFQDLAQAKKYLEKNFSRLKWDKEKKKYAI